MGWIFWGQAEERQGRVSAVQGAGRSLRQVERLVHGGAAPPPASPRACAPSLDLTQTPISKQIMKSLSHPSWLWGEAGSSERVQSWTRRDWGATFWSSIANTPRTPPHPHPHCFPKAHLGLPPASHPPGSAGRARRGWGMGVPGGVPGDSCI